MNSLFRFSLVGLLVGPCALIWVWQSSAWAGQDSASRVAGPGQATRTAIDEDARAEGEQVQVERARQAFKIADYDKNGWLSFRELGQSLEIDRPRYLVYDKNRDGKVTGGEFLRISLETYRRYGAFKIPIPNPADPTAAQLLEGLSGEASMPDPSPPEYEPVAASSILELFGQSQHREVRAGRVPEPDQLVGPVFSFRRLDQDNDGGIGIDDLTILLLGSGLDDRPAALIASLDTDADGQISVAEFRQSMASQR